MMFCGRCGGMIIIRRRENGLPVKYVCTKHNREGFVKDELREDWGCSPHAVNYADIKNTIMDYVKQFIDNESFKEEVLKTIESTRDFSKSQHLIDSLKEQESTYKNKLDILYDDRFNGILPDFLFEEKSKPLIESLSKVRSEIELLCANHKSEQKKDPIKVYENCIRNLYDSGLTSEGLKSLFEKIIIYEPGDISERDKATYEIPDEQYEELYKQGGYLFVQKAPWNTIKL